MGFGGRPLAAAARTWVRRAGWEESRAGTRHQTPDTRHQTPDTRHQTPDTRHQTPDTRHQTPDTTQSDDLRLQPRAASEIQRSAAAA
jgi:hypothetical protein